jgi:hypothetical protein
VGASCSAEVTFLPVGREICRPKTFCRRQSAPSTQRLDLRLASRFPTLDGVRARPTCHCTVSVVVVVCCVCSGEPEVPVIVTV